MNTTKTYHADADRLAEVKAVFKQQQDMKAARQTLDHQIMAACRRAVNTDTTDTTAPYLERVKKEAANLLEAINEGRHHPAFTDALGVHLLPLQNARYTLAHHEHYYKKVLIQLGRQFQIWDYVRHVRGMTEYRLACLIAEAGDIGTLPSPKALWKRLGVGIIRPDEAATFRPVRRDTAYLIGEGLAKARSSRYRDAYEDRRESAAKQDPAHAHKRALRHTTRQFLQDLWFVWHGLPVKEEQQQEQAA